jgi:hypothetical protein
MENLLCNRTSPSFCFLLTLGLVFSLPNLLKIRDILKVSGEVVVCFRLFAREKTGRNFRAMVS